MKILLYLLALLATVLGRVQHKSLLALSASEKVEEGREDLIKTMFDSLSFHIQKRFTVSKEKAEEFMTSNNFVAHSGTAATLLGCRGYDLKDFNDIDLWLQGIKEIIPAFIREVEGAAFVGLGNYAKQVEPLTLQWQGEGKVVGLTDKNVCEGGFTKQTDATACTDADKPEKDQLYAPPAFDGKKKSIVELDVWDGLKADYKGMSYKSSTFVTDDQYTTEIKHESFTIRSLNILSTLTFKILLLAGRGTDQKETDYKDIGCICKGLKANILELSETSDTRKKLQAAVDKACVATILSNNPYKKEDWFDTHVVKENSLPKAVSNFVDGVDGQKVMDIDWQLKASEAIATTAKAKKVNKFLQDVNDLIPATIGDVLQKQSGSLK